MSITSMSWIVVVLVSVAVPALGLALCALILALQIAALILRMTFARGGARGRDLPAVETAPVFSVHVATHNEPPRMVEATLRALASQTWPGPGYEVIVIDNNTQDPDLWKPVRACCAALGPRFRFLHETGVTGAKAGALNIALRQTRPDATHVVTVDADYCVTPDFLALAAAALARTGADYVQFPQAYAGCDRIAAGVDTELEEYFRTNARMADDVEAVLLTGTLSVISKAALETVGGWSGRTTTEDAEMGVRLCRAGFRGRFVTSIVGRGLLPFSLADLEKQRHRWTSGNVRTLMLHAPTLLSRRGGLGWRRRAAILTQLTAWVNLSLLPAGILLGSLFAGRGDTAPAALAGMSVLLCFGSAVAHLAWCGLRDGKPLAVVGAAMAQRIALAPVSALATLVALTGGTMRFVVTDKFRRAPAGRRTVPVGAAALFAAAALAWGQAVQDGPVAVTAVGVLMLPLLAALPTALTLERYRRAQGRVQGRVQGGASA